MEHSEKIEIKLDNVFINFTIIGSGWMDVILFLNNKNFVIDWVSYVCDPFGDLARNATKLKMQKDLKYPFINFDREGSESFFLGLIPLHKMIEVILYKGVTDPFGWDENEVEKIESEIMPKEKFINNIYSLLRYIKENFTKDEYIEGWDSFPQEEFVELEKLLK